MSADNWGICPKCHKKWKKPSSGYGKLTEEEYLEQLKQPKKEEPRTMREDYGLGIDEDGEFVVEFAARCKTCGFKFEYKHSEDVSLK